MGLYDNNRHTSQSLPDDEQRSPKWWKWLAIATAVLVTLSGGWVVATLLGVFDSPDASLSATPTPTPTASEAPEPVLPQWPLSGVRGEITERPALVVKVENAPESRPQDGLEDADIVFEEMVEGGISRLVAVFHSSIPTEIAPIRSIRPMDGPIASWTKGLMIFSGGQYPFIARAEDDGLQIISMDYGMDGFSRVYGRPSPHDVAGDTDSFYAQADTDHQASPPAFAAYAEQDGKGTAQLQGTPTAEVSAVISPVALPSWTWNPASDSWLRSEAGVPALTYAGPQISAKNILFLSVDVVYLGGTDAAGSNIPETIVVGKGAGLLAAGGMSVPITWQKDSETGPWQFFDTLGSPIELLPGNTWVELVPSTGTWSTT